MIRDTRDTSLTFENIEELKYWIGYKRLVDYMGFEVAFCTIEDINNALLQMEDGTVIHWFEEVEI